jgi:hypothetical protein
VIGCQSTDVFNIIIFKINVIIRIRPASQYRENQSLKIGVDLSSQTVDSVRHNVGIHWH